jgi:hypothetical protein
MSYSQIKSTDNAVLALTFVVDSIRPMLKDMSIQQMVEMGRVMNLLKIDMKKEVEGRIQNNQ